VLVFALTGLFVAPLVFRQYGYHDVVAVWRTDWGHILAVGILTLLTYILVLQAYTIAHVSYVGALREVSIVLAALAGWRWLGEAFGALRTVGALLIFVGIVVIATAG